MLTIRSRVLALVLTIMPMLGASPLAAQPVPDSTGARIPASAPAALAPAPARGATVPAPSPATLAPAPARDALAPMPEALAPAPASNLLVSDDDGPAARPAR
ncbi:MAG: hypothetical protein ACKOC6_06650, partial [bacterium]